MAQWCEKCRTKLPRGEAGPLCTTCQIKMAAEKEERERRTREAQERYDEQLRSYMANALAHLDRLIQTGGTAFLYRTVHLDIDSMLEDIEAASGLDLFDLNHAGVIGWEIVAAVPRTYSGSQSYISKNKITATSWGGGSTTQRVSLSGNVVGSYVLMKLAVDGRNRELLDETIRTTLETSALGRLGARPT